MDKGALPLRGRYPAIFLLAHRHRGHRVEGFRNGHRAQYILSETADVVASKKGKARGIYSVGSSQKEGRGSSYGLLNSLAMIIGTHNVVGKK